MLTSILSQLMLHRSNNASPCFLKHLILRHFRGYDHAEISFSPHINVIHGHNGQGKSNLLEAIYFLSTGRSFRTRSLADLIQLGATHFYLEAHFHKDSVDQTLKVYYDKATRKIQYNASTYTQLSSLLGLIPQVLISPEDHQLINGSPAERRRFIDLHIAQQNSTYLHHLSRYYQAMKQRNLLFKHPDCSSMPAWEQIMAPSAAYLMQERMQALSHLSPFLHQWMRTFSHEQESLKVTYQPSLSAEHLLTKWALGREEERRVKSTLWGPHRDDLDFCINEKPAKLFASEGQKRCGSTALRFAEWERLATHLNGQPLLSIDDFGIQLDAERSLLTQSQLTQFGQVFLTTPIPIALTSAQFIRVERGRLQVGMT